jgi:ribosomal protein L37E
MTKLGRPRNKQRDVALAAGKLVYASAVPCKRCGTRPHYVSNSGCVHCGSERGCAHYAAIKDDPRKLRHYNRHHHV